MSLANKKLSSNQKKEILEKAFHLQMPIFPVSEKYKIFFEKNLSASQYDIENHIPWEKVLTPIQYENELRAIKETIYSLTKNTNLNYFENIFQSHLDLFQKLVPAKISSENYIRQTQNLKNASKLDILQTFKPNQNGFCPPPTYDTLQSKTGRMRIANGPKILLLDKEIRKDILTSRHGEDGNIWYFDYSSLEPRIFLYLSSCIHNHNNKEELGNSIRKKGIGVELKNLAVKEDYSFFNEKDLYTAILNKMNLAGEINRQTAKEFIIAALYGQGDNSAQEMFSKQIKNLEDFSVLLENLFHIKEFQKFLFVNSLSRHEDQKWFYNTYGRPIVPDSEKSFALSNYFVQSTAVDVALIGFKKIVDIIYEKELQEFISPIYLLHDAIFFDIHKDAEKVIPKLENIGSKNILFFEDINFHLKATKL